MNIIIPLMGSGKRFYDKGYAEQKPFIKINGKPMLAHVIEPLERMFKTIYVACNHQTAQEIHKRGISSAIKTITLANSTGAADTIYQAVQHIDNNNPVMCIDCDTILTIKALERLKSHKSCIATFKEPNATGIYSYVKKEGFYITSIEEKQVISSEACAGVYIFKNKDVIKDNYIHTDEWHKENYLSYVVKNAIQKGSSFQTEDITSEFNCVGTPYQLKQYSQRLDIKGKTFCFDLDATLIKDLYNAPEPIQDNVRYCNWLYNKGAKIIIYTARGMRSTGGNTELIKEKVLPLVRDVLQRHGIKYHEIITGKPYADYYIDDKAIDGNKNLEQATGVYYDIENEPRLHHQIEIHDEYITKSGQVGSEANYYSILPADLLQKYFPKIINCTATEIKMERIKLPSYSKLLLDGKLDTNDLKVLFASLNAMHNYNVDYTADSSCFENDFYSKKLVERYAQHKRMYDALGMNILKELNVKYQLNKVGIIHGDPVMTNVFLGTHRGCKFIDPRGEWNGTKTYIGDVDYDHSKVIQSLYGYDFVLNGMPVKEHYVTALRSTYISMYDELYGSNKLEQLLHKVKNQYATLIPFHMEDTNKLKGFAEIYHTI